MRLWITKNGEVPVHEQLIRQIMLAILSEDLPAGHKLPSTRALARRYQIHSNTVSAAYRDLEDRGWLELRRGSGLYVRPLQSSPADPGELDVLIAELLRAARGKGHEPAQVLRRLEQLVLPRQYSSLLVVDPEAGMREILKSELEDHLALPVDALSPEDLAKAAPSATCLVAALHTRAASVRELLPPGAPFMTLRLRSVGASLAGQPRPSVNAVVSIVSKSAGFRTSSREVLIAVGLDPECLCEIDSTLPDWQQRTTASALIITDAVSLRGLPDGHSARVFRVIADSCIDEIKQLCPPKLL